MTDQTRSQLDRETWITECGQFILDDIISQHCTLPETPWRASIGFPSGKPSKVLAQCWKHEASADGYNEIFVSPTADDSMQILEALTHELVHYSDNCESGHQNHFARVARVIGLEGKLTATHAGPALRAQLQTYIDMLGPIPHAKLDHTKSGKKKQGTRMLKVQCNACDFHFRATAKHIAAMIYDDCLACETGSLCSDEMALDGVEE